jgi:hypothetical protein
MARRYTNWAIPALIIIIIIIIIVTTATVIICDIELSLYWYVISLCLDNRLTNPPKIGHEIKIKTESKQ